MPGFLMGRLAGPIASGVAALLLAALIYVGLDSLGKNRTNGALRDEIHNPVTGYVVRLAAAERDLTQCRSNRITLEEAARRQNEAVEQARKAGELRASELDRIADGYRKRLADAESRVRSILGAKGTGNHCADADRIILESVR